MIQGNEVGGGKNSTQHSDILILTSLEARFSYGIRRQPRSAAVASKSRAVSTIRQSATASDMSEEAISGKLDLRVVEEATGDLFDAPENAVLIRMPIYLTQFPLNLMRLHHK